MTVMFVDTETTGLDPDRHCVWEIGVVTEDGKEYEWVLELTEAELSRADPTALRIGRYYERSFDAYLRYHEGVEAARFIPLVSDRIPEKGYIPIGLRKGFAQSLVRILGINHLVGSVPSFDDRMLREFLHEQYLVPSWHYHLVDVEALAAGKLGKQPPWNSKTLYRDLGLDLSQWDSHTALADAHMARAIYLVVYNLDHPYQLMEDEQKVTTT